METQKRPKPLELLALREVWRSNQNVNWRRGRYSNPGYLAIRRFSRPVLSATQPPLHKERDYTFWQAVNKEKLCPYNETWAQPTNCLQKQGISRIEEMRPGRKVFFCELL